MGCIIILRHRLCLIGFMVDMHSWISVGRPGWQSSGSGIEIGFFMVEALMARQVWRADAESNVMIVSA